MTQLSTAKYNRAKGNAGQRSKPMLAPLQAEVTHVASNKVCNKVSSLVAHTAGTEGDERDAQVRLCSSYSLKSVHSCLQR